MIKAQTTYFMFEKCTNMTSSGLLDNFLLHARTENYGFLKKLINVGTEYQRNH